MRRTILRVILLIVIIISVLLQLGGCFWEETPEPEQTPDGATEETEPPEIPSSIPIANDRFTLRYNPKSSLNPITGTDPDNLLISSLMYEGLFVLDGDFNAVPVLCESYTNEPGFLTYTFTIKQDISMSDGSRLTANDVAYSINRARQSGRYVSRLSSVESVTADDSMTVTVTLSKPNSRFVKLMDIPVIKYGYIDSRVPPGTGPYILSDGGENLVRFSGHRDFTSLPVGVVYLKECGALELIELFSDGEISLICDDPGGAVKFYVSRRHETRYYNTTSLQYIGFNTRAEAFLNTQLRRAIGIAVDRAYIIDNIMPEYAIAAPLALPQYYSLYNTAWESKPDTVTGISSILADIGFADSNMDSYLEYPAEDGRYMEFTVDFIVNKENEFKIKAANRVADTLRRVGINITVRELAWEDFLTALEEGDFDMYYGELLLTADLDLTPLLEPGGAFDFGEIGSDEYTEIVDAFLAASGEVAERAAAGVLCAKIDQTAPFIPVLYKKHAVHSVRGVVTGAVPTQSSVFYGLTGWNIKPGGTGTR